MERKKVSATHFTCDRSYLREAIAIGYTSIDIAKQDRDNIDEDELAAFRGLAKSDARLTEIQVTESIVQ